MKRSIKISIFFGIILISLITFLYFKHINKIEVFLNDNLNVEVNSNVKVKSLIKDIKNATILKGNELLDTSSLGEKEVKIVLKNKRNKKVDYVFKVNVIDSDAPVITANTELYTFKGVDIDLLSNVKVEDNFDTDLTISLLGEYDINKEGVYNLTYQSTDSSGNTGSLDFTLQVNKDPKNYTFVTSKGFKGEVKDGVTYIDGILVVNKTYSLPSSYGSNLTKETKDAFNKMEADARKEGLNLYISSGYRSYDTQEAIYNRYVSRDGKTLADTYSARPGHSEHQTGLAFDLNTINDAFSHTEEAKWVHNNAYKYGLILRYPESKMDITGYKYESWHLRYVGTELSSKLYNNGDWITLEEYFGIDSKYE